MSYDPFARGPHPVGVRSHTLTDLGRSSRSLPIEVWYPADDQYAGADLDPARRDQYKTLPLLPTAWQAAVRDAAPRVLAADGALARRPLVLFSHGLAGHRRQSTFVCTHLASHGYLVIAVDHTGNTTADAIASFMGGAAAGAPRPLVELLPAWMDVRPPDVIHVLDSLLGGALPEFGAAVDAGQIGLFGHSFGGWTTLTTTARDNRIRAAVALAPAGGDGQGELNPLPRGLDLNWLREVPLLMVAAEHDSILPLAGVRGIYERAPTPKRLVVLANTDHMHFCDDARGAHEMFRTMPMGAAWLPSAVGIRPFAELLPARPAQAAICGLTLAHFDGYLRRVPEARVWLREESTAALEAQGVRTVS